MEILGPRRRPGTAVRGRAWRRGLALDVEVTGEHGIGFEWDALRRGDRRRYRRWRPLQGRLGEERGSKRPVCESTGAQRVGRLDANAGPDR